MTRGLRSGVLMAMAVGALGIARAEPVEQIGIRLYNFAEVSPGVLAAARGKASAVFGRLGIRTEWWDCPLSPRELLTTPACAAASGPANLVVKIVPNEMAKQFYSSRHSLGFAVLSDRGRPTSDAWVFYDRVVEQARAGSAFVPSVLGYAMAHEIGHLLLGKGNHTSSGIMKGAWGLRELRMAETGELRFTKKQEKRVREQVRRRAEMATAVVASARGEISRE